MNLLLIMADEHRRDAMGCAGHPVVQTPHLDALAARGTRYTSAYCMSPLCVPSRASFATGRYVHEVGCWDNASPYRGNPDSWGCLLQAGGVEVTTIGKLDFDGSGAHGFEDARFPAYRQPPGGDGALHRHPPQRMARGKERLADSGPGDYWSERVERETREAERYLLDEAPNKGGPWALWLNYLPPHFPLIAPEPYYRLYPEESVDSPVDSPAAASHPVVEQMRDYYNMAGLDEATARRSRSAYYGLCTLIDAQVGRVLAALEASGQADDTLIVYTSDHGDHLGDHELWWKGSMYEMSVGVPLLMAGPGIERGRVEHTPVSLVDLSATMLGAFDIAAPPEWRGTSLLRLQEKPNPMRAVFSEYHAHGASTGIFMVRQGPWKLVHYEGYAPELFHLERDPFERCNLADEPKWREKRLEMERTLAAIIDPTAVDRAARRDQAMRRAQEEGRRSHESP